MAKFTDYFKLPLIIDDYCEIKVFTDDRRMAFDWLCNIPCKKDILSVINGTPTTEYIGENFTLIDGVIYFDYKDKKNIPLLRIRGWGMLTGSGFTGYGLSADVAKEIQDDFALYIKEKLDGNMA
jgi:hypothetical protein